MAQAVRPQPAGEISLITGLAEPLADTGGRQRIFPTLAGMVYPYHRPVGARSRLMSGSLRSPVQALLLTVEAVAGFPLFFRADSNVTDELARCTIVQPRQGNIKALLTELNAKLYIEQLGIDLQDIIECSLPAVQQELPDQTAYRD